MTHLESLEKETKRKHDALSTLRKRLDDVELSNKREAWCFRVLALSSLVTIVSAIGGGGLMLLWLFGPAILLPLVFLMRMATREDVLRTRNNVNTSLTMYVDALCAEDEERTRVMMGNLTVVKAPENVTEAYKTSQGSADPNKGLKEALDAIERRIRDTHAVPQNIIKTWGVRDAPDYDMIQPEVATIVCGDFEVTMPVKEVRSYVTALSASPNRRAIQVYWGDGRCDIL